MKNKYILIYIISILLLSNCTVKWTEAISYGAIEQTDFHETLDIDINLGLIFLTCKIKGENYRFLLDTGAPFSISQELQDRYQFNTISKGHIVDTDQNRMKVNYVTVDNILLGGIPFTMQTALVADFKRNPVLECLNIDGIIGSNLMRHCKWTIDQQQRTLSLSSSINKDIIDQSNLIPFQIDNQYNILVDVGIGQSSVKNLTIDFGSNGSIGLPNEVFSILQQHNKIGEVSIEHGVQQSGIIGTPISIRLKNGLADSVFFEQLMIENVELRSGSAGLIGTKVLSRFLVSIDWSKKALYLSKNNAAIKPSNLYGFKIGYIYNKGVYIQSIIESSPAYITGLRPNMQVVKINSIDFSKNHDFCDYITYMDNPADQLLIEVIDDKGSKQQFTIDKRTVE